MPAVVLLFSVLMNSSPAHCWKLILAQKSPPSVRQTRVAYFS
jgi:hypothetical protein